jgi:DNA-directed RNA polymerase subunit F
MSKIPVLSTEKQVLLVKEVAKKEKTIKELANEFGIKPGTAYDIVERNPELYAKALEDIQKKIKYRASELAGHALGYITDKKLAKASALAVSQTVKNLSEIGKRDDLVAIQINNTVPDDKGDLIKFIKSIDNTSNSDN